MNCIIPNPCPGLSSQYASLHSCNYPLPGDYITYTSEFSMPLIEVCAGYPFEYMQ